ncbi:MAG: putative flagellar biosynthesis protein FlhA [Microvirga sp.]|jgi:flagellar biosynthesis protein FlhA|nr:putative flagellar biosynthesis protein FlhA [Microvirga sp.]
MNWLKSRLLTEGNDLALVLVMIGILMALFMPVSAGVLDFLLLTNFLVALLILLVTFYTEKPLSFSTFPSLLLMTTLFRLSLNISATRLILDGADAGKVINTVGSYVVGGNYVTGFVVFLILIVVQYVVVTNGAQRVAEVAARFTLDSLPGKQMSIDADLNMGIIDHEEAKRRRSQLEKESNFYGAMDGASKFVKGDAVAGIIIILINIVGGLLVGMIQLGMSWGEALHRFTLLTIGDGIVTQIPSLIIAVSAGIIITRAATDARLGNEIIRQFSAQPRILIIVAVVTALLMLVPGLPLIPLVVLLLCFGFAAWMSRKVAPADMSAESVAEDSAAGDLRDEGGGLGRSEPFELRLAPALAAQFTGAGNLFEQRIENLRRQFARDNGFVPPALVAKLDPRQQGSGYTVAIQGAVVASGEIELDKLLAINPGHVQLRLEGKETREPTYGLAALWISEEQRNQAKSAGYTLVEPETVLVTHLSELAKQHAPDFLTRAETERLIDQVRKTVGSLVDELVPQILTYSDIQRVLQLLLREQVSIRNLERILEVMADVGRTVKNHDELTERIRERLGGSLYEKLLDKEGGLHVITLAPAIESHMLSAVRQREGQTSLLPAAELDRFIGAIAREAERQLTGGRHPVLLCASPLRRVLRALLWRAVPHMAVLSSNEVGFHNKVISAGYVDLPGFTRLEAV